MKTLFILLDSLNRHYMNAYGTKDVITPNLDRLTQKSVVFDNHWCGSAPCMPARRDILTGRLNFLERPWGGIEPFDHTLPALLRERNVYTHMETDHYHYAEPGGENYWGSFTSWNLHRGAETDTFYWNPDKTGIPAPNQQPSGVVGVHRPAYESTRAQYAENPDSYSTSRTLSAAADWLERNHDADNYLLWVEGFAPHEPFDVPQEFLELYPAHGEDPGCYWPQYDPAQPYTEQELEAFQRRYSALLTMTDQYLGRLLDVLDAHNMWKDTAVILTTDHGYLLGEHGFVAKNFMPDYNEIYRIPMMVALPGVKPGRCSALSQTIDLFPTILELFGVPLQLCRNPIHAHSLLPLLLGEVASVRETALYGVFGKTVNITDGKYAYLRCAVDKSNEPLSMYVAMPAVLGQYIGLGSMRDEDFSQITPDHLSWTGYPVFRVPARLVDWHNSLRIQGINRYIPDNMLFDLEQDPTQQHPIQDAVLEAQYVKLLCQTMEAHDSPREQLVRLGL